MDILSSLDIFIRFLLFLPSCDHVYTFCWYLWAKNKKISILIYLQLTSDVDFVHWKQSRLQKHYRTETERFQKIFYVVSCPGKEEKLSMSKNISLKLILQNMNWWHNSPKVRQKKNWRIFLDLSRFAII